ncbi:MAG: transposase [Bacteroides sp.]|nr:transposase [Bacteroides sp.]
MIKREVDKIVFNIALSQGITSWLFWRLRFPKQFRWVIERTLAWFDGFRKLTRNYEASVKLLKRRLTSLLSNFSIIMSNIKNHLNSNIF